MADLYASRILRIGLVNSGMFDLLELNLDVQAVHLVGENNVGKTSLITLMQFLYFHNVREMTFPKTSTESLTFYFPYEGGYLLFEVRTLNGTRRTVGIYGTGTADSRVIFVFDGGFVLEDFLDEARHVLPLKQAQDRLFDRNFRRYARFEDYEKALIGQHTDGVYNVQMFELTMTNFRLLRNLLQGLLRLDRITSDDVRQFLIQIVKTAGVKTQISVAEDYERKNREIQTVRRQLLDLQVLQPLIERWQAVQQEITDAEHQLEEESIRLYHLSARYLTWLQAQHTQTQGQYQATGQQLDALEQRRDVLLEQQAHRKGQIDELNLTISTLAKLKAFCTQHSKIHVEEERNRYIHQQMELQKLLDMIQPDDLASLQRQRRQREQEQTRILRQMEQRTLDQVWLETGFAPEERALLTFLLSERLISLTTAEALADPEAFVAASRHAVSYLDAEGAFRGLGLIISRIEWYMLLQDAETLAERLARAEQALRDLDARIEIARDRAQKETELHELRQHIQTCECTLKQFAELVRLETVYGSQFTCEERLRRLEEQHASAERELQEMEAQRRDLRKHAETLFAQLRDIAQERNDAEQSHRTLQVFETACPENVSIIAQEDLKQEYHFSQNRVQRHKTRLTQLQQQLSEPRIALEARYEREAPDLSFEAWVVRKLDIAHEVARFEEQLYDSYTNLITRMRGELDKLVQAFEAVEAQVAALNNTIRKVQVSNIERIEVRVKQSDLVAAIRETSRLQLDLFSFGQNALDFEQAQVMVDDYLSQIRTHGKELRLSDMFLLEFSVTFTHSEQSLTTTEIHQLESHGTETGVKVVLYLGLIRLLQSHPQALGARIPFFLDEVGSIDQHNLKQLISYCDQNNFLPIFASPEIRQDIPCNYIFRRNGARSVLVNTIMITPELHEVEDGPA